jgi:hypothetical protein
LEGFSNEVKGVKEKLAKNSRKRTRASTADSAARGRLPARGRIGRQKTTFIVASCRQNFNQIEKKKFEKGKRFGKSKKKNWDSEFRLGFGVALSKMR